VQSLGRIVVHVAARTVARSVPRSVARSVAWSVVRRVARSVVATIVALAAVAPATAGAAGPPTAATPIEVRDDRGVVLRLVAPPRRIVSLLPSLTETVCALGACDRLVGVDRYADWPPEVRALPRLGGLDDTPIEGVVASRPDVVLMARSGRAVERLEALGVRVLVFESDRHADVERSLAAIAALLGTPGRGTAAWAAIQTRIDAAAARVPPRWRGQRVYFELGGGPWAAGEASFIGETLSRLGLAHAVPRALGAFPQLNPEFVLRAQPGLVMGAQDDVATMAQRPGWSGLRALAAGRVCGFARADYDLVTRPGPRLGEAAERLADCLSTLPPPAEAVR
jgi:iron complex transport system substrate-binding protein